GFPRHLGNGRADFADPRVHVTVVHEASPGPRRPAGLSTLRRVGRLWSHRNRKCALAARTKGRLNGTLLNLPIAAPNGARVRLRRAARRTNAAGAAFAPPRARRCRAAVVRPSDRRPSPTATQGLAGGVLVE